MRPWRPSDFGGAGGLLDLFAREGPHPFSHMKADFLGYNEIVVDAHAWLSNLPHSVEAIFIVDCMPSDKQLQYGRKEGTAADCAEAHTRGAQMHRRFVETYGLSAADFPLLKLRPGEWDAPFSNA